MKHKNKGNNAGRRSLIQHPDEEFVAGPLRMARFGRHTVSEVNWSQGEFDKLQARLCASYDEVVQEIDCAVAEAAALVATMDPLAVLHRAWWERSASYLMIDSEVELDPENAHSERMIDYVQSLIASTPPVAQPAESPSEEDWGELQRLIETIFQKLNSRYFMCSTAKRRKDAVVSDPAFEVFHFKAQLYWCNVTGRQYQLHHIQTLRELLAPQSRVIQELYDLSSEQLCDELAKIWHSLTKGIADAADAMFEFKEKSLAALAEDIKSGVAVEGDGDKGERLRASIARHGLEAMGERASGLFLRYDLFDLQKVTTLPPAFLKDFSWAPGQDGEFFAEGGFKGWPLRIWPIFKRPFIHLDGRYYCFDISGLFDHFFRQLERRVFAADKNLKQLWIDARKEVTETLPFEYLQRLLPGAVCFKEVYYWMGEAGKAAARYETDGILEFDDHLFIVEVKAGAFTYTSPADDVDAHVQSLKNLVAAPAKQGNRFLRYLQTADEVPLLDEAVNEVTRIRLSKYRHVSICTITLDPFTEIAAQIQHLPAIGVEVGNEPVWSLSLDDLRVYADIFTNPLEFLHFVQMRKAAFNSQLLQLDDELDHLGLYLRHNDYPMHAAELVKGRGVHLQFIGYRQEIDKFFSARLLDDQLPSPLRQKMHPGLTGLLEFLRLSIKSGRSAIAAYLLDMSGDWRDKMFAALEQERVNANANQPRPFSTFGEIRLTTFPWTPKWGRLPAHESRNHAKAMMLMNDEPSRVLLELSYDERGSLVDAEWQFLRRSDITIFEMPALQARGESLRDARLHRALATNRHVGRNDQCPCGSGKKFKKCCIDRT
jgi:SEC-C motif